MQNLYFTVTKHSNTRLGCLENTYYLYQSIINAYKDGREEDMFKLVHSSHDGISTQMKKALETLIKHESSIRN